MADDKSKTRDPGNTRRGFLASVMVGGSIAASSSVHASNDYPPVFANPRHQFTLIEPAAPLPFVMLKDQIGHPAPLWHRPGRLALINIWAMWCVNCRRELPLLQRLFNAEKHSMDIFAICVDRGAASQRLSEYLSALNIQTLPILQDAEGRLAGDPNSPLPVIGMPLTYIVRPNGTVAGYIAGEADWQSQEGRRLLSYFQAQL